jgi:hypothetical protein
MSLCKEVGEWIRDHIERPIERFFEQLEQVCTEVSTPIERIRQEQQEQCAKQECIWYCLCCNKWFCTIVTVVLSFIEWVIETVCKVVVTIVKTIVMILVEIIKWVVIAVVCIFEALCKATILLAALALLLLLVAAAALPIPAVAPLVLPFIGPTLVFGLAALALIKLLCEVSWCRLVGIFGWALKWAVALSAALALAFLSMGTGLAMAIYGGSVAALMIALESGSCRLPPMRSWP